MCEGDDTLSKAEMIFEILRAATGETGAARLGRLSLPGREAIQTPNFIATTSRGSVPHVTPDNISRHTSFGAAYFSLEDCKQASLLQDPQDTSNLSQR
jgi:queuine tRNA-ribosyltransferase accessory subunit